MSIAHRIALLLGPISLASAIQATDASAASSPPVVPTVAVPAVASSIGRAIARYFTKEGSQSATEYLSKQGGKEIMERVAAGAAKQGGEQTVQQIATLTGKYGPDVLAALDNSPSMLPVIKAIEELPPAEVSSALIKLAAGTPGRELAEATARFGSAALRTELKHPGAGLVLVRSLGDDGIELASRLSTDQVIAVGRHADDIAKLPAAQRTGVLGMLRNDTERMIGFLGRFVEANPLKTLFTVATTTVILAEPERILGGDEIVFDADGNPIVVRRSGLIDRTMDAGGDVAVHVSERYIRPVFLAIAAFTGTFAVLWLSIKLWHSHRREQLKTKLLVESSSNAESTE